MSSAILYLAIVAIWACVLVPRWLRRAHENHSEQEGVFEQEDLLEHGGVFEQEEFAERADPQEFGPQEFGPQEFGPEEFGPEEFGPEADPLAWEDAGVVPAGAADPEETQVHAEYSSVSYSITTLSVESVSVAADDDRGAHDDAGVRDDAAPAHGGAASYDEAVAPGAAGQDWPAGQGAPADHHAAAGQDSEDWASAERAFAGEDRAAAHAGTEPGSPGDHLPAPGSPGTSPDRARVLRARRRLLTMLIALASGTAACAVTGFMPWPVLIVPIGLLGLYLMLLREAARAAAENARRQAEAHARAVRAEHARALREQARETAAVAAPQQTAQVINLAALAAQYGEPARDDQLYDQYTDAEIRAVGD